MKNQKKTLWLNLKKCLRVSGSFHFQRNPLLKIQSKLHYGIFICLLSLFCTSSWAVQRKVTAESLEKQIQFQGSQGFASLIRQWESSYGTAAVDPLLRIAKNASKEETKRYVALMGAAKLGGASLSSEIETFLQDSSWMLRSAALRLIAGFGNPSAGQAALPLLHDKALVVRAEAVETIRILKPAGSARALLSTLNDPENYHRGKALWVPQKALRALASMHASEVTSEIQAFLRSKQTQKDPELKELTQKTLSSLNTLK